MKEKTLHVVNGMSARHTLRQGFELMNMKENIVYLPIDFSIGYIPKDFSDKELCFALASHNNIKAFAALKKFVTTDYSVYDKVIVWHGWSAYDLLLLYLMSVLVKENLYQVDIRDCEALIKKERCEYLDMGYVSPYNVFEYNMISLAKPICEQEQIYYQKRWHRWTNSKTSYRFSSTRTGIIKEYPNDYFDNDIIEALKKHSSLRHVVAEVMWKYQDLFIPDSIIYNRLNQLYWEDMFHLTITINEEKNEPFI